MSATETKARGLEGVVALDSRICHIDGAVGELVYAGYDIRDLAPNVSFEETAYLLWHGELPGRTALDALEAMLVSERALPPGVLEMLDRLPSDAEPMAVLRTAVSSLGMFDSEAEDMSPEANFRKAVRLTARMPAIIASWDRIRKGHVPLPPMRTGSAAADFLYQLSGNKPGEAAERTFDACLVLHAEHGLNASTFAGRVIAATLADVYACVSGCIGALKGPLHGGANIKVMEMLHEIQRTGADPAAYIRERLAKKDRVMGFGHRVYKTLDPRAAILREMLDKLSAERGSRQWYEMSLQIMQVMEQDKKLYPNVDFFSASVYATLGIDSDLFTPIFAMSRITGWTAHMLEQWVDNRLIRPRAAYSGPAMRKVVPIARRG